MEKSPVPGRRLALTGGVILLILGLLFVAAGISASGGSPYEGLDFSLIFAMFAFAFAVPPLIVAIGILRHHRSAYVLGVIVGGLYGVAFLGQAMRSGPIPGLIGALFLAAAIALLDSLRPRRSG